MEKRLKNYLKKMNELGWDKLSDEEKASLRADLLVQIGFFQHERLVHLFVTVTFAILTLLGLILNCMYENIGFVALEILFLLLLIPYVRHYYILENGVQKLYGYFDRVEGS